MKIATMDIGSGTVRVLMCRLEKGRYCTDQIKRRITRLADDFAGGRLHPVSLARTAAAARDLAREARSYGAVEIRAACTGVTRRATNAGEFLQALADDAGLDPVVIAGEFEAQLSAQGASSEAGLGDKPFVLIDIGGFSTEFAKIRGRDFAGAVSVEVGSVSLTDRHMKSDPPTPEQLAACAADVQAALGALDRLDGVASFGPPVGTAGTITTLAAIHLKMERYDPARLSGVVLTAPRIEELLALLVSMPAADRLSLPGLEKGREDLMPAGAIICREALQRLGAERLLVTEGGLLQGLALCPEWPPTEGRWLTP
jgi:exopolyphosphatase/guanosine-5'-triphosphate,3'-diphosphate pyrophosphatase